MENFAKILKDLLNEYSFDEQTFAGEIDVSSATVNRWLNNKMSLKLSTAIKIANVFNCSLDYLLGRSLYFGKGNFKTCPPIKDQLRKVLKELNVSQYSLIKNKIVSAASIDSILNKGRDAQIETIIKLADYLDVSLDYLVGRE